MPAAPAPSQVHALSQAPAPSIPPQDDEKKARQQLEGKKIPELKVMLKELRAKIPGKKPQMIDTILKLQRLPTANIDRARASLTSGSRRGEGFVHQHYRRWFNGVDLHDRYWNRRQDHHTIKSWRAKFVFSLFQSSIVNGWVLHNQHKKSVHLSRFAKL